MKACWADDNLLPASCVLDSDRATAWYDCIYTQRGEITDKQKCPHWDEALSVDLAKEILGDEYNVLKTN